MPGFRPTLPYRPTKKRQASGGIVVFTLRFQTGLFLFFILMFLLCSNAHSAEQAADCKLQELATLKMLDRHGTVIAVPAKIDGKDIALKIDFGGSTNYLYATPLLKGKHHTPSVNLALGSWTIPMRFAVSQDEPLIFPEYRIDGVLGMTFLQHIDLEIDNTNRLVRFFLQSECEGDVVHWKHSDLAVIPFKRLSDITAPIIDVTLDGQRFRAALTTLPTSTVADDAAEAVFGSLKAPPTAPQVNAFKIYRREKKLFRHQFSSLSIGPFSFQNPWMLFTDLNFKKRIDILLGMHQLRELHIYFAFDQKKLYVSSVAGDRLAQNSTAIISGQNTHSNFDLEKTERIKALIREAEIQSSMHLFNQALQNLNDAIALDPRNSESFRARCSLNMQINKYGNALRDCEKAVQIDPTNTGASTERCAILAGASLNDRAVSACTHALSLIPGNLPALFARGRAYLKSGRAELALADFESAVRLDKKSAISLYGRGLAKQALGDTTGGRSDMEDAEDISPNIGAAYTP